MGIGFAEGKPLLKCRLVIERPQIYSFASHWESIWYIPKTPVSEKA
jgi:hypothetical protein